jgi:hypothetical protein
LQHEVYQDLIQREASKHMQLIIIIFNWYVAQPDCHPIEVKETFNHAA